MTKSKLISQEAAIDAIRCAPTYREYWKGTRKILYKKEDVLNAINELPSAESEWIPVSEGLPEEHEWVGTKKFGTTISDKVHITFDVNGERFVKTLSLQNGELSDYEKRVMDTFHKGWKMLAWMPLPKPYREDGKEYELATEQMEHDALYEPTYNSEDGSM